MQPDHLESAERICREEFGESSRLSPAQELVGPDWGRSTVWRCSLSGPPASPATVIVKASNLGGNHGANEASILARLDQDCQLAGHLPRLHGFDARHGLLVLSDLGEVDGKRLADWRDRLDRSAYMGLLTELMQLLGSLNRSNMATDPRWQDFSQASMEDERTRHAAMHFRQSLQAMPAHFSSAAYTFTDDAMQELEELSRLLADPAGHCLTHADICPSNVAWIDGRLLIYDFEVSGLRHPAIDGAWARMRCLRCFHCTILDMDEVRTLENAWLREFGWDESPAGGGSSASEAISAGCLAWLAAMLDWLPDLMLADRERDRVPDRQRMLASLQAVQQCQLDHGCLKAIAEVCHSLQVKLEHIWPESAGTLLASKP